MVQKSQGSHERPPRRRGRPRAFDPDVALTQAMDAFWKDGFAATSLDDLSAATGLNRPSLYGAFGDKRAFYVQAYRRYREHVRETFAPLLAGPGPLRAKLERTLLAALDFYLSGEDGPRGCFTVLTASSDAIADPEIQALVAEAIEIDRSGLRAAVRRGSRGGRTAPRRRPVAPSAHGGGDHPHALNPRARRGAARGARPDRGRRGGDDLRACACAQGDASREAEGEGCDVNPCGDVLRIARGSAVGLRERRGMGPCVNRKESPMIVVTTENVAGHRTTQTLGQCFGVVVRSRGLGGNVIAGLRSIVGGEIHEYTQLLEEARRHALDRLVQNATAMGANAILMMRYDSAEIGNTMSEIVAYGTAAVIERTP